MYVQPVLYMVCIAWMMRPGLNLLVQYESREKVRQAELNIIYERHV